MRFILFNIAVAVSLIYLFNQGELDSNELNVRFEQAKSEILRLKNRHTSAISGHLAEASSGITQPQAKNSKNIQRNDTKGLTENIASKKENQNEERPNTSQEMSKLIEKRPLSNPDDQNLRPKVIQIANNGSEGTTVQNPRPKSNQPIVKNKVIAKRRDEVLKREEHVGLTAAETISLSGGTELMPSNIRSRELDYLVEEMELLFVEKVGN